MLGHLGAWLTLGGTVLPQLVFVQLLSCVQLFSTLQIAARQTSLPFTISHAQTHVHRVSDAIQLSHPVSPSSLPALNLCSIRVFSNELALYIIGSLHWLFPVPKYWNIIVSPFNEYSGLISFRIDWLILLSKGLSRVFSRTTVRKHQFFSAQPPLWFNSHICT